VAPSRRIWSVIQQVRLCIFFRFGWWNLQPEDEKQIKCRVSIADWVTQQTAYPWPLMYTEQAHPRRRNLTNDLYDTKQQVETTPLRLLFTLSTGQCTKEDCHEGPGCCMCGCQIPYSSEEAGGVGSNKFRIAEIPSCARSTTPPEKMDNAVTITTVHFFPVFFYEVATVLDYETSNVRMNDES
jgi:hypothetical protein